MYVVTTDYADGTQTVERIGWTAVKRILDAWRLNPNPDVRRIRVERTVHMAAWAAAGWVTS